jgi:hypothetical protein
MRPPAPPHPLQTQRRSEHTPGREQSLVVELGASRRLELRRGLDEIDRACDVEAIQDAATAAAAQSGHPWPPGPPVTIPDSDGSTPMPYALDPSPPLRRRRRCILLTGLVTAERQAGARTARRQQQLEAGHFTDAESTSSQHRSAVPAASGPWRVDEARGSRARRRRARTPRGASACRHGGEVTDRATSRACRPLVRDAPHDPRGPAGWIPCGRHHRQWRHSKAGLVEMAGGAPGRRCQAWK